MQAQRHAQNVGSKPGNKGLGRSWHLYGREQKGNGFKAGKPTLLMSLLKGILYKKMSFMFSIRSQG